MGCKVAIADWNEDNLEEISLWAKENQYQDKILTFNCDVSDETQVKDAVEKTVERFGTIHAALCSAAVAPVGSTLPKKGLLKTKYFQLTFNVNVLGSVHVAKYASFAMSKNKANEIGEKGVIVFVSSI